MTIQNLLQQCRKKSHSKVLRFWVVLAAVALLLVLACRGYDWDALGRYKGDNISSLHYVRGRVVEVLRDDTKPDQLDPARSMGTQELRILLLEGANKGTEVTIANYLTRTQNVRLRQGETAIICEDLPDSADTYYTVYNYDRAPVLVLILAVFAAAVVAIGGDYFANEEGGYVVRMGEAYRKKPLKSRDMLVTDSKGNFHILKNSDATQLQALMEAEDPIVNVFNFGPALVIDGVLQEMPETYNYNIRGKEPRCAIGQLGELEYLLVVVDGRGAADSEGCDVATLAQFMYDQGCTQAYNLDGGNSALMYFNGENYSRKSFEAERSVSDIIYFSTAIDYGLDETAEEE